MDAVLPLTLRDVPRSHMLLRSLDRSVRGLRRVLVVMPDAEVASFRPCRHAHFELVVLSELQLLPELRRLDAVGGWYRQQLVKLAAADWVQSACYLTLDADVIATRSVCLDALCVGGRAPCYIDHADLHPRWYRAARALLDMRLPRAGISHNVTPCILQAEAVRGLCQHLTRRWQRRDFCAGLRGLKQRVAWWRAAAAGGGAGRGWVQLLAASAPWSEYSLYYSFLEASGQFERHHHEARHALYEVERSVWFAEQFDSLQPQLLFAGDGPPYFVVVQSNTRLSHAVIAARFEPWLAGS